jgi:hypothetical protein
MMVAQVSRFELNFVEGSGWRPGTPPVTDSESATPGGGPMTPITGTLPGGPGCQPGHRASESAVTVPVSRQ